MKRLVILTALSAALAAQSLPSKKQFLIRIQPVRPTFADDMTAEEEKIMGVHFEYLKKLANERKVVLAGPSINGTKTFGIIVVEVDSEAEARNILESDPSYRGGLQKGEVLPFRISILRSGR